MAMSEERTVLCGANAYDKKYYYNEISFQLFFDLYKIIIYSLHKIHYTLSPFKVSRTHSTARKLM